MVPFDFLDFWIYDKHRQSLPCWNTLCRAYNHHERPGAAGRHLIDIFIGLKDSGRSTKDLSVRVGKKLDVSLKNLRASKPLRNSCKIGQILLENRLII